jgi:hypothetical protein
MAPWVKGQSGNPGGRPKTKAFHDALTMELATFGEDHRALRAIAHSMINKAISGDVGAAMFIADRLDGKVPQPVGGSDELGPTRLHITWSTPTEPPMQVIEGDAVKTLDGSKALNGS